MADFLSQSEIDGLVDVSKDDQIQLNKLFGEVASNKLSGKKNFTQYDFKRPNRISREQLRTLRNLHDKISRDIASSVSAMLRTMVEVNLASIDQITYGEFTMSLRNPTSYNVLSMKPLEGNSVLEINTNIAQGIVERLLGGNGIIEETLTRDFSEIELSVLGNILNLIVKQLKKGWSSVHTINFNVESKESNFTNVQIASSNEIVVLVTYDLKIKEEKGFLSLCYPILYLEPILNKLLVSNLVPDTNKNTTNSEIHILLAGVEVQLSIVLFQDVITLTNFLDLNVGGYLISNVDVNAELQLTVNFKPKYWCTFGVFENTKVVKITSEIESEKSLTINKLKQLEQLRELKLNNLLEEMAEFENQKAMEEQLEREDDLH